MSAQTLRFEEANLARIVETLTPAEVDALPFGAIRLDDEARVSFYSQAEATLSGYGARQALGGQFFTEIAPCMSHASFLGRIERARLSGKLDIEFGYVGDFDDADKELRVRVQSATGGGYWIFMARD